METTGPLSESERPTITNGTPEADKLAEQVYTKYHEAKSFRRSYDKDWPLWYRFYAAGDSEKPKAEWRSDPRVNFIFATIETIVPIMTDNAPQITVVPAEPGDTGIAEVVAHIVKRIWVDEDMDVKLPMVVRNALKYGTGFVKAWWNPALRDGLGDVAISVVDPRHMYPAPGALDFEDAESVVYAANVPLAMVERRHPAFKGKIPTGIWDEDLTVAKTITSQSAASDLQWLGPIQSTDGTSVSWPREYPAGQPQMDRKGLVTLAELWYRDDHGRVMVTVCANGIVLRHGASPFRHNQFPFVRFTDYSVASSFWGMGETQQLYKLQEDINKRRGQIHDILRITGNPPFVVDSDSGINPKALTSRPGAILYKNRGSDAHWLQPPVLPGALFSLQEMDKRDFDTISGIFDVTQGRRPVGIEAASAIIELQEAAQTRIRLKVRNMEASLRKLGKQVISLVQAFYTEQRTIRLVGTGQPKFVEINKKDLTGASKYGIINDVSVGEYDLEIGVGSTMPVSKTRRFSQMLQMFRDGVVDQRAVLENSGLSTEEVEVIMARMMQQQQQLMQMEQGASPPGEGTANQETLAPPTEEELNEIEAEGAAINEGE